MLHDVQAMDDAVSAAYAVACRSEPQDPSKLQCYVEGRLQGLSGPAWFDGQAIDQASRAAALLGGLMAFGPDLRAAEMNEEMWDTAGRTAWPVLLAGDAGIRDLATAHPALPVILAKNSAERPVTRAARRDIEGVLLSFSTTVTLTAVVYFLVKAGTSFRTGFWYDLLMAVKKCET